MKDIIYLDHAATTPPLPCAWTAFQNAPFGNPSSAHGLGKKARDALEGARARVARCVGAEPGEIVFVSGATEGAALVLNTLHREGYYIEESPFEHHAVSENIPYPKNDRILDTKAYAAMLVNNETGEIFNLPKKENEYQRLFSDLTAAVGHIPVNVKELGLDYGVFTAHKFGGLPGIGAVYVRDGLPLHAMQKGGGQEMGRRAGTESVGLACAMAAALDWQTGNMTKNYAHVRDLASLMFSQFAPLWPDVELNLQGGRASPYILNVSFPGAVGTTLGLMLSERGVMVSAGAACSNGLNEPSHVLMAMYGDEGRARSAIRISFSHANTEEEVRTAAE